MHVHLETLKKVRIFQVRLFFLLIFVKILKFSVKKSFAKQNIFLGVREREMDVVVKCGLTFF
jgi:hypothetical protein